MGAREGGDHRKSVFSLLLPPICPLYISPNFAEVQSFLPALCKAPRPCCCRRSSCHGIPLALNIAASGLHIKELQIPHKRPASQAVVPSYRTAICGFSRLGRIFTCVRQSAASSEPHIYLHAPSTLAAVGPFA